MNNIYKVIWSKAKNCYVVASEIARSHTKSASGSEKIGGGTRRKLLVSLMALSLLCGGLGVAEATVHVNEVPDGTKEVYTIGETYSRTEADARYAKANDVTANTTNIATNKANITALQSELDNKADATALDGKANTSLNNLDDAGKAVIKGMMTDELEKKADKSALNDKANTDLSNLTEAGKNAIKTTMTDELEKKVDKNDLEAATNRIAANEGEITALKNKTGQLSADGKELKDMTTVSGTTVSGTNVEAGALKVNGVIKNDAGVTTTLEKIDASMTQTKTNKDDIATNKGDIATNKASIAKNTADINDLKTKTTNQQTAIDGLNAKTINITHDATGTSVDGVTFNAGKVTGVTSINGTEIGTKESGTYIHQDSSIWGNMIIVDAQVKTNADAIGKNTDAITALDTKVGTVGTGTYLDPNKSVGDNLGLLDAGLKNEVDDRKAADTDLSNRIGTVTDDGEYIKKSATNNVSDNLKVLDNRAKTNADAIAQEAAKREEEDNKINTKIGSIDNSQTEYVKQEQTISQNLTKLDKELKDTNDRTGGITRNLEKTQTTIESSVKVDNQGNVKDVKGLSAETIETSGNATIGGALTVTGESSLKNTKVEGTLTTTGQATFKEAVEMDKGLTVTSGDTTLKGTKVDGKLTVTDDAELKNTKVGGTLDVTGATTLSGELTAKENATFEKDVTVKGTTNLKDTNVEGNLKVTGTITTDKMVFGDKATNNYTEIDHGKVTSKNLEVNGAGETISSSSTFNAKENKVGFANSVTGEQSSHKQTSDMIVDNVKNNITGDQSFHKQTSDVIMDNVKDLHNSNNRTQTKTETKDIITDKDGNSSTTSQTASENKTYLKDKDGKNTNSTIDTAKGYDKTIKGENGETSTKQDELNITNTAQNGTITNDAQNIVNNATGDMTNTVGGKLTTTVTGQATEEFNGGLNTTVTGTENHTVNGKQINTVTEGQENIISGGQTNTITGGQINNITGDQTTTITGNKTETVTENVTEDYKKNLTTTVGGNEIHEVKGTKTETVEGKLTENFKGGQETNVTGDQDIKVSGTQTTTATDIKRNASSGMIDTIDNDYGTNTETKVAGETKTEVSIKGTDEKGEYIRGATQSRDYLIKGTLKNSETKTAEATSSEVTDGTNKASTIQDAKNLAGSVTNGTETGVSGIHANDDGSVSIDSAVVGGGMSSVINQKKDSITSAVGDGTNSTVILQDKDNVTIASSNGTVGIVGKDIVNNATGNMTNTVGGNQTNTIGGDQTTTVTGDISNTAKNITNEASNSITDKVGDHTRVLDGEGITDTVGGSTFKQRIDKIMMESKDVSIKAEETLTNEAKVITNKASEVINNEAVNINNTATGIINSKASEIKNQADKLISNKVGENTSEYMEDGKITTSVKDGAKSTVTIQNADGLQTGVTNGTSTNASATTATSSAQTIASGNKANSVITTIDGTQFVNSEAATPVTGASGAGNAVNTTIKGNTITTGKVTMDYADVMKDLGVRGNATVKNNLNVEGITTTKTLSVTENATVGGTLDVTGKATFKDSVSIAKDLTVGGDVTAKSYKVGDKTYISADGINANDQKITNVADGSISEGSKDAVNGGQLYQVKNDLEGKVNKVGANAAAMANLHPMEFDPDSKWNIAAAMGNYGSETATAIGAFYRPNEDVMVNFSTAFGTGENMVGGGVSVRLGKGGNKLSREESNALKDQVNDLTARMDALLSVLNPNMSKDFPDVPENHWAYEAVSRLAGNDIVQGYPDGEFHGDRTMTRYEMAEIIYNALSRGAEAEKELVEEFKPELQAMAASEKATAERAQG